MARGFKTGGRKKGTPNKRTVRRAELLAQLYGRDPITFFASILQDKRAAPEDRILAARELLPYMHPKLASIEARAGGMTHEDRLARLQEMAGRVLDDEAPPTQGGP